MSDRADAIDARFMFALLSYETWNLFVGSEWIAQVTLNHVDRSIRLTVEEMGVDQYRLGAIGNFASWCRFIKAHSKKERHSFTG